MGELSFWDNVWATIREFIGHVGFKMFLWSCHATQDEYLFGQWYMGVIDGIGLSVEKIYGVKKYSDTSFNIYCGLLKYFEDNAEAEWKKEG